LRNGKHVTLRVTIGELPAEEELLLSGAPKEHKENRLNVVIADLSQEQRRQLNINGKGVLVKSVNQGPAYSAGIRKGDIILRINNVDIENSRHFQTVIEKLPEGKSIPVLIHRRGSPIFLAMKIGKDE
jgi:serine protease Do